MELDALFGEGLEPPTEADLQHNALLQLLQPGAGAGKPSSPQPAASLMAAVPAMYLHKLEPHPLAGMEADDRAPGRWATCKRLNSAFLQPTCMCLPPASRSASTLSLWPAWQPTSFKPVSHVHSQSLQYWHVF